MVVEVIKTFFFFLQKNVTNTKKHKKHKKCKNVKQANKKKLLVRLFDVFMFFYAHKEHLKERKSLV